VLGCAKVDATGTPALFRRSARLMSQALHRSITRTTGGRSLH